MTAALLNLERDLLSRARRLTVLKEAQGHPAEPQRPHSPRPRASLSAAAPPMQAAQEDTAGRPVPVGVAALTSSKLRSRVRATMSARGHKRVRWTERERAEWHELVVVRGEAA